jgi:hypothetical protein
MAKVLIMLVRLLGLTAIVVGALLWSGRQNLLGPHIGLGFVVATVVFVMAIMIKKAVVPGILGVVFAMLLPVVGFMQLPLLPHTMGAIQAAHIFLALAIIGVAERLYSAIHRAA